MFTPSRDEVRRYFCDVWRKYRERQALSGLEATALEVISAHPEYHALLERPEDALGREWSPEGGEMNPFLHLSLHLAIEEQLSIDQPRGVRARYDALFGKSASAHEAKHVLLECLGETIWRAQRKDAPPDEGFYLECLARRTTEA